MRRLSPPPTSWTAGIFSFKLPARGAAACCKQAGDGGNPESLLLPWHLHSQQQRTVMSKLGWGLIGLSQICKTKTRTLCRRSTRIQKDHQKEDLNSRMVQSRQKQPGTATYGGASWAEESTAGLQGSEE